MVFVVLGASMQLTSRFLLAIYKVQWDKERGQRQTVRG